MPFLSKLSSTFHSLPKTPRPVTIPSAQTPYKTLRPWQQQAYDKVKDERLALIVAQPGAGKSTLQIALPLERVVRSSLTHKVLIVCPKRMICEGFVRNGESRMIGLNLNGVPTEILVEDLSSDVSEDKGQSLRNFLLNDVAPCHAESYQRDGFISGSICVTTHANLAHIASKATPEDIEAMIVNTTFVIDEAHHIRGVFDEDAEEDTESESNRLGQFIHTLVNKAPDSTHLILASATPFRADKQLILSAGVRKQFDSGTFTLPLLDYISTTNIECIDMNYSMFDVSPADEILRAIEQEPKECHLIAVPRVSSSWRRKPGELDRLVEGVRSLLGTKSVLNLVPDAPALRRSCMERLAIETKNDPDSVTLRCILFVAVVSEGVDWPACSRFHNAAFGSSLPNEVQKIGRTLRDFPGKTKVGITAYLPSISKDEGEDGTSQVNTLNNTLLIGMHYNDAFYPVIPQTMRVVIKGQKVDVKPVEQLFSVELSVIDQELMPQIEALRFKHESSIKPLLSAVLAKYCKPDDCAFAEKLLETRIIRQLAAHIPHLAHINMDYLLEMGFNRIISNHDLYDSSFYTCTLDHDTLREFHSLLSKRMSSLEEEKERLHTATFTPGVMAKRERKQIRSRVRTRLENKSSTGRSTPAEAGMLDQYFPAQYEG